MGKTPVHLSASDDYRAVVRHIHVLPHFDRLQLALLINIPYGTVSRIITELFNEGYIERLYHLWNKKPVYEKREWSKKLPQSNGDMRVKGKINWAYTDKDVARQQVYCCSSRWNEFLQRWNHFLKKGEDTWQAGQRTASSSKRKTTRRTKRGRASPGKTKKGTSRSSSRRGSSSVTVIVNSSSSASTR